MKRTREFAPPPPPPAKNLELQLTKREYFAGLAMQSLLTTDLENNLCDIAKEAVHTADRLLEHLNDKK
ncbi:hypothetical protein [Riemerella columbina]|uniref:hypothetical protein n=1 Tax=Riemerella columbina TaxID=103810 RepID=UPI0003679BEB|nr:hypothetical protein [Riemerella columbina]